MAVGATGLLLVPLECGGWRYEIRSTTGFAVYNTTAGTTGLVLLLVSLLAVRLPVLRDMFNRYRCKKYGSRCHGVACTMATAAWNMAVRAVERLLPWLPLLWNSFYSCVQLGPDFPPRSNYAF